MIIKRTVAVALFGLILSCSGQGNAAADQVPPSIAEAALATYSGLQVDPKLGVTLQDGKWEGEPAVEGSASRPAVALVRDFHVTGDLDGDGTDEAIVMLSESGGGTGELTSLAVLKRVDGAIRNIATLFLGDRTRLRAVRVEPRRLVADLVQAGPEDAMCCPGEMVQRSWEYEETGLRESGQPVQQGRLSPDALGGTEWVLRFWELAEAAPAEPAITLRYTDGQLAGHSGCNRYFAVLRAGESPGEISIGPVAGTRMACDDPAMKLEDRFLMQLGSVSRMGFMATSLMLTYEAGDAVKVMLFEKSTHD